MQNIEGRGNLWEEEALFLVRIFWVSRAEAINKMVFESLDGYFSRISEMNMQEDNLVKGYFY